MYAVRGAGPGANPNFSLPGYTVRRATSADLPAINRLAEAVHFDVGMHNLQLYYGTSPHSWHVVVDDATGQVVAYDSYNGLHDGMFMGFQITVRGDLRGKGITRLFNSMTYSTFPGMGNATPDSIERYYFEVWGPKFVGYFGTAKRVQQPSNIESDWQIVPVSAHNIAQMCDYDRSVLGMSRRNFLTEWTLPSDAAPIVHSFVARSTAADGERLSGWGAIRLFSNYWQIGPLYADSETVGAALFERLVGSVPLGTFVYLTFPATCGASLRLATDAGLTLIGTEMRTYARETFERVGRAIDWPRVFAMHEYWPA